MARPKADINGAEVLKLASLYCSDKEIAEWFGVSVDTITRRFADVLAKGRADLKTRIRKAQIRLALKGNAVMLIWLGKQYLGQSDKPEDLENESQRIYNFNFKEAEKKSPRNVEEGLRDIAKALEARDA